MMKASEAMTRDVEITRPDDTIEHAARLMAQIDAGALPVGEGDRLVGMITDRDIAIRVAALGKDPRQTRVRDAMTGEVEYCFDDEDVEQVTRRMGQLKLRRLPVMNRDKRLVGLVSLGDVALETGTGRSAETLEQVSRPGQPHNQSEEAYSGAKPNPHRGDPAPVDPNARRG
jgi:CBS domain-containing protein